MYYLPPNLKKAANFRPGKFRFPVDDPNVLGVTTTVTYDKIGSNLRPGDGVNLNIEVWILKPGGKRITKHTTRYVENPELCSPDDYRHLVKEATLSQM